MIQAELHQTSCSNRYVSTIEVCTSCLQSLSPTTLQINRRCYYFFRRYSCRTLCEANSIEAHDAYPEHPLLGLIHAYFSLRSGSPVQRLSEFSHRYNAAQPEAPIWASRPFTVKHPECHLLATTPSEVFSFMMMSDTEGACVSKKQSRMFG